VRVKLSIFLFIVAVSLVASSSASGQAPVVISNNDAPGVGFNDSTPVTPVGGNVGTTRGQQRMNAVQFAANIWGATLSSSPTITIRASWVALACTADDAVLASAGATDVKGDFANATFSNTWFSIAEANALSGSDLNFSTPEINARFNLNLGASGCLDGAHWYFGLDGNEGFNGIDLVSVALHEFGHGLGFSNFTNTQTGAFFLNTPSVWDRFLRDNTSGRLWVNMTPAERAASAVNTNNLVWAGPQVTAAVPGFLTNGADSANRVRMYAPNPFESGSSVSHFDRSASPSLLMEPSITSGLNHNVSPPFDLTFPLLRDIGWNTASPPPPTPPSNDNFASAQVISGCSGTVNGTNVSATKENGEPDHLSQGGTRSVWYQWVAPSTSSVTIRTAGSSYDTVLGVYTGSAVNNLVTIRTNDDVVSGDTSSRVIFDATAGTVYRIAVGGFNNQLPGGGNSGGDVGQFVLNWEVASCTATLELMLDQTGPAADQASAIDSILFLRDPFLVLNPANLLNPTSDKNTRVVILVRNLPSVPPASAVVVNLIDSNNNAQDITAQDVRAVPNQDFIQVTFRLPSGLPAGTCRIRVLSQGLFSNTATIRIRT
jgi:hypothetical protein